LHTADNEWFSTKTQNLNHPHLIRRSEISHTQKTRLFLYQNPKAQFSSPQHTWSLSYEIHTPQTTLLTQIRKAQFSLPHHSQFSFVKFTYHRHCSGTKIHWQRSCTQRQELNSPSLNHTWFSRYEIHTPQTMWLYQNPKRPKNLILFISSFLVSKLWKRFTSGRQVFLCRLISILMQCHNKSLI
jgi:hypothetical protein